jgi:hypothetical protein
LNNRNTRWYLLETTTCEEPEGEVGVWVEEARGGDRKRVKNKTAGPKAGRDG